MTSTPITFPKPADHNQLYPDYFVGDAALENGKVYQFDTVKELCTRGILIDNGRIIMDDNIHKVLNHYNLMKN